MVKNETGKTKSWGNLYGDRPCNACLKIINRLENSRWSNIIACMYVCHVFIKLRIQFNRICMYVCTNIISYWNNILGLKLWWPKIHRIFSVNVIYSFINQCNFAMTKSSKSLLWQISSFFVIWLPNHKKSF